MALHNNPPNQINMADARRLPVLKLMAPALAKFQPYTGQEPPDDYLDKVIQSWAYLEGHMTVLENANAGDFDNAVKCNILKSMMGGKYAPVPANNGLVVGNPAINSPDTLRAWMRAKYQRETVGNQQSAIQRLTQERYQSYDTPDTYEARIRPLLLGVVDNDAQVLGFLKSHLTGDFYTWMRIANPAGINAFFTELKNMWLERGQNLSGRIPEELSQIPNQIQALPSINPVSYSLPLVAPVSQQQGHAISLEDMQKAIQNALAQQKTENQALVKKVTELESQMAKQTQVPALQTVEPVRQPRGPPSSLQTEEGMENYRLSQYLNNLGIFSTEDLERNYPIKPFQRSRPQRSNVSARIDRVEEVINENRNAMNQLTEEFQKLNIHKGNIAKSNFNRSYFTPLKPINLANEENSGYDEENDIWYDDSEKKNEYQ